MPSRHPPVPGWAARYDSVTVQYGQLCLVRLRVRRFWEAHFLLGRLQAGQLPRPSGYGATSGARRQARDRVRVPILRAALHLAHAPLRTVQHFLPPGWPWGPVPPLLRTCCIRGPWPLNDRSRHQPLQPLVGSPGSVCHARLGDWRRYSTALGTSSRARLSSFT
jgi:hypothetical protein